MCITFTVSIASIVLKKCEQANDFMQRNLHAMPAEGFAVGFVGGCLGRAAAIPFDPELRSPMARMVAAKTGTPHSLAVLYRFSPYWALRMPIYANSVSTFGENNAATNPLLMFPYFVLVGAWTEVWARAVLNPFNKVRYHRDLAVKRGDAATSVPATMQRMFNDRGVLAFVQDTAKYRVECAKVGVLFGVYHSLRNTVLQLAGKPEEAHAAFKAVVDLTCGGAAGAASVAATHALRQSSYEQTSVFAQRCMSHYLCFPVFKKPFRAHLNPRKTPQQCTRQCSWRHRQQQSCSVCTAC